MPFAPDVQKRILDWPLTTLDTITEESTYYNQEILCLPESNTAPIAVPLHGSKKPGYSAVYRNRRALDKLISTYHPKISTSYQSFLGAVESFGDRDCLGRRTYDPVTKKWSDQYYYYSYNEVDSIKTKLASGLVNVVKKHAGLDYTQKYVVAMYLPNCPRWVMTDLACQSQSLPSVCLYDTLGPNTSEYILNFCNCPVLLCSAANLPKVLTLKPKLAKLKVIICTDSLESDLDVPGTGSKAEIVKSWGDGLGVSIYTFDDVVQIGTDNPVPEHPPTRDDIYAINFTSGTTGMPKGAILTQGAVLSTVTCCRSLVPFDYDPSSTAFSFLPLAHIFERCAMCTTISLGVRQAYPHGPLTEILDDIGVCKPTYCTMVPRVLNRIASSLKAATIEAPGLGGIISRKAFTSKLAHLRETGSPNHFLWDRVWSNKIRKRIGFENLKFIVTGSAPLGKSTMEFLKVALGIDVLQGYGLTESLSGMAVAPPGEKDCGSCGAPGVAIEVKLRDVPELGYSSNDKPNPRGEIMLRGPQMFKGYLNNDEKTREALDEEGWFYTGDVGEIDSRGRIFIIDRVKNFFKLAQGEYVAAEKIENIYVSSSSLINQIFVHGNSHETFLVAICAMNPDSYAPWLSKLRGKTVHVGDVEEMKKSFADETIRKKFLSDLNASVKPGSLNGFERVKNVYMDFEPLTVENECLTPTLKIVRAVCVKTFSGVIEEMYKRGPILGSSKEARL